MVVRSLFLFLSRRNGLRRWMETWGPARRLSTRFVAGETLADALITGKRLQAEGITLTLDHLGESVTNLEEAAAFRDEYLQSLQALRDAGLESNVSLKLTQFGLDLSYDSCLENVEMLVRKARETGGFVRVDMESTAYTDRTLQLVTDLHARHGSVGTVIQAYLYRSREDVERLSARGIRVRLCKGAYLEPRSLAFPRKDQVDRNYAELTRLLLDRGTYPAIATHDERMIEEARVYARKIGRSPDQFEFQMLYGIRRDLQRQLVAQGYRLRLYVPYGRAWYPYYMRRLAERPANLLFILRNLLKK